MRTGAFTHTMLAAMLAAAITLPTTPAAAADCDDVEAKIAAAKTAADHEGIATCFDEMAKAARAKAEEHKEMGAAYRKSGGPFAAKYQLPQHCDYFTKTFTQEAKTYDQMAAAHRQMAKSAK